MGAKIPHIETLAIHAGRRVDPVTGAVATPLSMSTTFERDADGGYSRAHYYGRDGNPNRLSLEACLAALEGGAGAAAFASGTAASHAVFAATPPDAAIVVDQDSYHGTLRQLDEVFVAGGRRVIPIDTADLDAVGATLAAGAALVWLETPTNPLLKVVDIAAVAQLARAHDAILACDNTFATPVLQQPLALGADLVVHSCTKYIGGHSDVTGGVVVSRHADEFLASLHNLQSRAGGIPSPFDCWLLQRSVATLPARIRLSSANALALAEFLARHAAIEAVYYPGLGGHPGHALAGSQMRAFGGVLSMAVRGGEKEALAVAGRARLWTRATSLGGVESLVEHRASMEGPATRTPANLLRLSVGNEHVDDLRDDLAQMLQPLCPP